MLRQITIGMRIIVIIVVMSLAIIGLIFALFFTTQNIKQIGLGERARQKKQKRQSKLTAKQSNTV
ncbi:MAG: hypothetical protein LBH85_00415 [Treponema sp.]|jgi:flagellar basal body-associated protein FliL|nr:hypothetical protein [Treponema sp.]